MKEEGSKKEEGKNNIYVDVKEKKKRGRKRIKEKATIRDQKKFFIDYSKEPEKHDRVIKLVNEANEKQYGREITFKDVVDYALKKVTSKDLEQIQNEALGEMDKVQMLLEKHNLKHEANLTLGEFLVKQLKIS